MINEIINTGYYKFNGSLKEFKRCVGTFKIKNVQVDTVISDVELFIAEGEFKCKGKIHRIILRKDFCDSNILHIEYKGAKRYAKQSTA